MMNRDYLLQLTAEFSENAQTNYLSLKDEDGASFNKDITPEYIGLRFFMPPIIAIGAAADKGFLKLKEPEVVGPHHLLPEDWLPEAKTVISLFLPYSGRVIDSNLQNPLDPSMEWLFTRVDGQQHLLSTGALVRDALVREGYRAVVPYSDSKFVMRAARFQTDVPIPAFSSNWSERHVAFTTGLGTFGRMTNLITKRGTCGRLISVVTDWETAPDEKDYEDVYGYCSECGACYKACPAGALSKNGKDIDKCSAYVSTLGAKYAPRYGCGKCQSGLPCALRSF